eukprot:2377215-Rhodomonas_salina.2
MIRNRHAFQDKRNPTRRHTQPDTQTTQLNTQNSGSHTPDSRLNTHSDPSQHPPTTHNSNNQTPKNQPSSSTKHPSIIEHQACIGHRGASKEPGWWLRASASILSSPEATALPPLRVLLPAAPACKSVSESGSCQWGCKVVAVEDEEEEGGMEDDGKGRRRTQEEEEEEEEEALTSEPSNICFSSS